MRSKAERMEVFATFTVLATVLTGLGIVAGEAARFLLLVASFR